MGKYVIAAVVLLAVIPAGVVYVCSRPAADSVKQAAPEIADVPLGDSIWSPPAGDAYQFNFFSDVQHGDVFRRARRALSVTNPPPERLKAFEWIKDKRPAIHCTGWTVVLMSAERQNSGGTLELVVTVCPTLACPSKPGSHAGTYDFCYERWLLRPNGEIDFQELWDGEGDMGRRIGELFINGDGY